MNRLGTLRRFLYFSTWRWLFLTATNPDWEPLFESQRRLAKRDLFVAASPWFAWNAIPILEKELQERRGGKVLEWGSGNSTVWFSQQQMSVVSYEHHQGWYDRVKLATATSSLIDLRFAEIGSSYVSPNVPVGEFSIFVIDGRERSQCAYFLAHAIESGDIKSNSLIIFDDSERPRYTDALEKLMGLCTKHRTYSGTTSLELDKTTTFLWV